MIGATDSVTLIAPGAVTVDSEGRTTRPNAETAVGEARVDELSARDVEIAAQVGQTHDIAVKVPLGTGVTDKMTVRVDDAGTRTPSPRDLQGRRRPDHEAPSPPPVLQDDDPGLTWPVRRRGSRRPTRGP